MNSKMTPWELRVINRFQLNPDNKVPGEPYTTHALIVCGKEGKPTHHMFVRREAMRAVDHVSGMMLVFACGKCGHERVWGIEAIGFSPLAKRFILTSH